MREEPDEKARAAKLRGRIGKLKQTETGKSATSKESGPRPGESPNAFVDRRMRETLKKR
jgi:hypothetical protein